MSAASLIYKPSNEIFYIGNHKLSIIMLEDD